MLELGETDLRYLLHRLQKCPNRLNFIKLYWQQMLEAVQTIGRHRIVHGDLKPANFVCFKGVLKLIDFGIAGKISDDTVNVNRESVCGTIHYLAPEGLRSVVESGAVTKMGTPADVWSLGIILYEMVYHTTPFHHIKPMAQKVFAITSSAEVPLPEMANENPLLREVLGMCLRKDPAQRATVDQLLAHPLLC